MTDADFEHSYLGEAYGTHQPFLETYVKQTTGDVIEFGLGHNSTGLLRHILKDTGRRIVSIDDNKEWMDEMKTIYPPSESHNYIYAPKQPNNIHWNLIQNYLESYPRPISVVFIDQTGWENRVNTAWWALTRAEYCIMHDADYFPLNGLLGRITDPTKGYSDESKYDFSKVFKNYKLYFPPRPWTDENRGPPTLVGTFFDKPIFDYSDILYN